MQGNRPICVLERFEDGSFGAKMLLSNTNNLVQTDFAETSSIKRSHLGIKRGAKAKREEHKQNAGHDQEAKGTMAYGGYGLRFLATITSSYTGDSVDLKQEEELRKP